MDPIGYRKVVVGDRDWRIIWRASTDQRGTLTIEIAEVWAVGARSDGELYTEMTQRVASLGNSPVRRSLSAVLDELGKRAKGPAAQPHSMAFPVLRTGSSIASYTPPAWTATTSLR